MYDQVQVYGASCYISGDILIIPFQADFYTEIVASLRAEVLQKLYKNPNLKGLIIDISQVAIIDVANMKLLEEIHSLANILGVVPYLVGMRPVVALTLIDLGYNNPDLNVALNISQATAYIHSKG